MPEHKTLATSLDYKHDQFLLEIFLNNSDRSIILTNEKFEIIFFNKLANEWCTRFVQKPLYHGMKVHDLAEEDKKEWQIQILNDVIEGSSFETEYEVVLPDKESIWYHVSYYPAKNDKGDIVGVLVNSKNITNRKKQEQELRISNERFELLTKATSDAIWDYDVQQKQIYYNDSFTKYFGYKISDWKNGYDLWEKHIHPEDRDRVITKVNQSIAGTDVHWEDEYRFILYDDSIAYVYDRGMILRNDDGVAVRMIGSMQDVTRQKENELKIALSEHRFRHLVQSGTDLIAIIDASGTYTYVSPSVKQLHYDVDFLLGKTPFDFIHPDDLLMATSLFQEVLNKRQIVSPPFRFKAGTGEWRWIETVATNLLDDPAINGIVANSRDITEKKNKDEALEKVLNDLNKVLDSSVDVIVVTDESDRYVRVSAAAEMVWGYKPHELIGKSCFELIHPDDVDRTHSVTENVMKGTKITNFQNRYIRKDGTVVPLIWSARWDNNEKVMYSIARDATEKLESEAALRKSESMFRAISESYPNGMVSILDKDLNFSYVAGREIADLGLTPEYFIGTPYIRHFKDDELLIRSTADKVFRGEAVVSELKFLDRNYLISSVPLYELDGSIERILVVAQNITAQKKTQKEKELLIDELTKNIHDLRQFSYITSHNLRAPISNLIGIMGLINTDSIKDADTAFLVEKFKESTYILNETVNDLLNILLIKNNVNVKKEELSLLQLWNDVCTSVSSQISKSGAEIRNNIREYDKIFFNKSYAESILLNLLTNAIKYRSQERALIIDVFTSYDDNYLVLHFKDNGIGINLEHHRDKIFGLYQRFHNYPDSKGLGLYLVHSQITALGGKIEVQSEINKGTYFKVYFKR